MNSLTNADYKVIRDSLKKEPDSDDIRRLIAKLDDIIEQKERQIAYMDRNAGYY